MDNLPPLRDVISRHNLFAKKSFGQHFLLDLNLTDKIARLAVPRETIVEVGPGPGGLTRSLLAGGADKVIAIEMDERFLSALAEISDAYPGKLEVMNADALKIDLAGIPADEKLRICANLPYNVGTKLVINWLTAKPLFWDRAVLMLQKEVAERMAAGPGDNAYGRLAILTQSVAQAHISFLVPASAFTPPPKVDSAIIVLDPLDEDKRYPDLKTLAQITAAAFGQRRKMLRKSLKPLAKKWNMELDTWLEDAGIDPTIRPETLLIKGFHDLADLARNRQNQD